MKKLLLIALLLSTQAFAQRGGERVIARCNTYMEKPQAKRFMDCAYDGINMIFRIKIAEPNATQREFFLDLKDSWAEASATQGKLISYTYRAWDGDMLVSIPTRYNGQIVAENIVLEHKEHAEEYERVKKFMREQKWDGAK